MNLLEFEGKALLKEHGITIPHGQVITAPEQLENLHFPAVMKSQVPIGGRGKNGGIRVVQNAKEARASLEEIKSLRIKGYLPSAILVEETIKVQQELYLSLSIDRKTKMEILLFSEEGGMNIEETDKDRLKAVNINPILGLQDYQLNRIFLRTELKEEVKSRAKETVRKLYGVFKSKKLELLEINPAAVTPEGKLICLDAKMVVDDNLFYQKEKNVTLMPMSFEEMTKALGVNGVELDGDIAVITSGAGLGLATIDAIKFYGGTVHSFVDLGPLVYDREKMKEVINLVNRLKPKVILFNFYFQVAKCDTLAEAIVASLNNNPVVVRARGKHEDAAKCLLERNGCYVTQDFNGAIFKTVELVSGRSCTYGNIS